MTTRIPWTPQQLEQLAALYPDNVTALVAQAIGKPVTSIYSKAMFLGLKKSATWLASKASGRLIAGELGPANIASQFQPGQLPWNAGRKGWQAGGRSVTTQFAKGQRPVNEVPIGSHRTVTEANGQQHLEQKVREVPGPNHKRWTPVSRLVWEATHGPVPAGSIIVFKPGARTLVLEEITLDRLDCLTRAQHAARNHPNSHSPEIAKLCQLKGAIARQVNRITREHAQTQGHPA